MQVIKRDGRLVPYDGRKIYQAVKKACESVGYPIEKQEQVAQSVQKRVESELFDSNLGARAQNIEEIQDCVIKKLITMRNVEVSEAYIQYREERNKERQRRQSLNQTIEEITFAGSKDSNIKRDNGNINGDSPMGMMLQYGSAVTKDFTDNNLLSSEVEKAVKQGDIYIHDKDFYPMGTLTCLQIPLDKIFQTGFNTGHGTLRPPQSIGTYASLAAIAIQANQNDMHELKRAFDE